MVHMTGSLGDTAMQTEERQYLQSSIALTDHGTSSGPLKKKKSLTTLFSLSPRSSRKESKAGAASTVDTEFTSNPPIPAQSWPLVAPELSLRISSKNPDGNIVQSIDHKHAGIEKLQERQSFDLASTGLDGQSTSTIDGKPTGVPVRNFSEPGFRARPGLDEHRAARKSSAATSPQSEKPPIQHAPTFPLSSQRSKTGLRMPSAFSSLPRGRGDSVTSPKKAHFLLQADLLRPSTAGSEFKMKPTGKRRPSERRTGLEGAFPFSSFENLPQLPAHPWQAHHNTDEMRSSFRSALTTNSSYVGTTSTERSSVVTEGTSITESTVDVPSRPGSKGDGMTVDDAIDMYVAGFADDDEPNTGESRDTSISEEDRRRSTSIAEALSDNIGGTIVPSRSTAKAPEILNAVLRSGTLKSRDSQPPSITSPTSTRDQYGFLKANHHVTVDQYDAWYSIYLPDQERRTKKWSQYMKDQGLPTAQPIRFPSRSTKTERFIRKGIPPAWRGPAWFFYAGGDAYLKRHVGLYSYLVTRSEAKLPDNDKEAIERDLHRTFPDNVHFKPDSETSIPSIEEQPILTSLRRVLRAYAFHAPRIGYCQSLNFLTGLLLLFLPEEKAFWMLHIITTVYLPGTHNISLEGANIDLWVLMVALKSTVPTIWSKVSSAGTPADGLDSSARLPPISLCTTNWFMSIFIGTLPIESVLRVWDVLFYEGSRTLFRVALTIFKFGEQRIKDVSDSMELFQTVQSLPRDMLDAGQLMTAMCRRGGVGTEWIEARRWERREWYAKERTRALVTVDDGVRSEYFASRGSDVKDDEALDRKDSIWARKKRKASMPGKIEGTKAPLPSPQDGISQVGRQLLAV